MPSSALQFDAYAFAQLHLLGLLSITHPEDGPQPSVRSDADAENNPLLAALAVPELLMANALCYLTEQIHQVSGMHARLTCKITLLRCRLPLTHATWILS